jgi:hypothetical protein
MKAEKAFAIIGKRLKTEYKKLGFKYSKKYMHLRKRTKKYDYFVFFSSSFEYRPDTCLELRVTLSINDRTLLKTNIYAHSELFSMNLWDMGNHYNIANETLINDTFTDLKNKIDTYLIPYIRKLEVGLPYTATHNDLISFG